MNGSAQDLRTSGGDFCGAFSNQNFGKNVYSLSYDEQILKGWGVRPSDWIVAATLQHELLPRVSVSVGYTRRWLQNFTVTDNRATTGEDYTPFSITAPLDPRLPGGGGYVVSGLYDVVPAKFNAVDNYRTYAPDYGTISQMYNGVEINIAARLRNGLQFQAGSATGQRVTDYCEVRAKLPEQSGAFSTGSELPGYSPTNPYCHYAPGFDTRFTGVGAYTVPKIDVLVSGSLTSSAGIPLRADWSMSSAVAAQWLGRPLAGNVANVTVNLLKPDDMRSDRVNQLDFRLAKILRLGRTRANIALDLFNALNLDTIIFPNQAFVPGGAWLAPTGRVDPVMTARTAKFTIQYDF
jgi:hypothetical protein